MEFGKRRSFESSQKKSEGFNRDFYNNSNKDPEMNELLMKYDGLIAFQSADGVKDDSKMVEQLQKEIADRYKQLNRD